MGRLKAELQAVYPGQPAAGRQKVGGLGAGAPQPVWGGGLTRAPPAPQLIYGGQVLSDRKPVREIVEGQVESETPATLHLIVREAGAPPSPAAKTAAAAFSRPSAISSK